MSGDASRPVFGASVALRQRVSPIHKSLGNSICDANHEVSKACSGTTTFTGTQASSTALWHCPTWTGDIVVHNISPPTATPTADTDPDATQSPVPLFSYLEVIQGDLEISGVNGAEPYNFEILNLVHVTGQIRFTDSTFANIPNLVKLETAGSIIFENVVSQPSGAWPGDGWYSLEKVSSMTFVNTELNQIGPFPPRPGPPANVSQHLGSNESLSITATRNRYLQDITFTGLYATNTTIHVQGTEESTLVVNVPDLQKACLHLSGVSSLNVPKLTTLLACGNSNSPQTISGNTFNNLSLPSLTTVDGTLQIEKNVELSELNLPLLNSVDDLSISYNPELQTVSLPNLTEITTQLNIDGPLDL